MNTVINTHEPAANPPNGNLERELQALPNVLAPQASAVARVLESVSKRVSVRSLLRLIVERERVQATLERIPARMQLATNQVRLMVELIDDFASGRYRQISWRALALTSLAVLYTVSPADVIPDYLPALGQVDDLLVLGTAARIVRRELERYCTFKGYPMEQYFKMSLPSQPSPRAN